MVEVRIHYQGELRCMATHGPSSTTLTTDAPKDNHGRGEGFSPTDLVATALGTCMLTLMGITAKKLQIDLAGAEVVVHKEMAAKPIRRIARLGVVITVPIPVTEEQKQALIQAAMTCPVHQSLHPDIQIPTEFVWA